MTGIELIANERQEQMNKHVYGIERDNADKEGLFNAALYLLTGSPNLWPNWWPEEKKAKFDNKPKLERCVVAGALLSAYLDAWQYPHLEQSTDGLIVKMILDEVKRAETKHPQFAADPVHRAAVVAEEAGELVRASLQYEYERGPLSEMLKEAIQTAATCIRILKIDKTLPVLKALENGATCTLTNEQEFVEPRFSKPVIEVDSMFESNQHRHIKDIGGNI